MYNRLAGDQLNIESEVANIAWFNELGMFWFAATCWEGQVAFITHPQQTKGRDYVKCKKMPSEHKRDVTTADVMICKNVLVTGSIDNVISFWNSFNGTCTKEVRIPAHLVTNATSDTITYLKFAMEQSPELLLVFMNAGYVYCLDTT
jgi:WD40 repeat protein